MGISHRSALIERVIEARRPLVARIAEAQKELQSLIEALDRLEGERVRVMGELDGPAAAAACERLRAIELGHLRVNLEDQRRALQRMERRFRREHLSIGVVGRARQGKSRLLQTLTGLGNREIPDGDRTHCTGVRSTIIHRTRVEPHADVWLHSEPSFLDEVIGPYYSELPELGSCPSSLDAWQSGGRPDTSVRLLGARGAKLAHLQRAFDALQVFRPLLNEPSPKRISLNDIRRWVAQTSEDGQTPLVSHLAVRDVKITCAFPHEDVARLQVVDMPGLGDTGVGDEARLLHTLGHEVDVVLFVRMPKALGDHWADVDVALYDLARRALPELPLERWCFFVLNRTRAGSKQGDNLENCRDLAADVGRQGLAAVGHIVANCADRAEVTRDVLDPVLEYMADQAAALDSEYATTCRDQLLRTLRDTRGVLQRAKKAIAEVGAGDRENPLFRRLFETTWEDLTGALESYLSRLQGRRAEEDSGLAQQIQLALEAARAHPSIPDAPTIERRRHARGSYAIAYNELLHEVRTQLSRCFLGLDDGLKQSLHGVKEGLAETLSQVLGPIVDAEGVLYLRALRERLPPESAGIAEGFDMLLDFDLSYRGLIQHRIRRHLDGLTPDLTTLHLSSRPDAEEIRTYLETLQKEALYQAEHALRGLLYEPSLAAFAMVEEFVDRVLRAGGARTEWDVFLFEVRSQVWPKEFDKIEARANARRRWEDAAQQTYRLAASERMDFLVFQSVVVPQAG